jgi:AAHS family 4-hydroxybenzoate transporter-like MFS transporter
MGRSVLPGSAYADGREGTVRSRASVRELFGPLLARDTAGLWVAFLFCLGGVYLVFGWLPTMLTVQGVDVAYASRGLAIFNFGGVAGVLIWVWLVASLGSRGPMLAGVLAAALSALAILLIPAHSRESGGIMLAALALTGLLVNAVQTSMFALAAHVYPTAVRASGVAYAAAVGRVGGVLSSTFGSAIVGMGAGAYWGLLAASMLIACVGLALVRHHIPALSKTQEMKRSA